MSDLPNSVTKDQLDSLVARSDVEYAVFGNKLTVAVITLPSNFKVTGEASCVDANNFDKALGEKYALENAVEKLWELEGYILACHLHSRAEYAEFLENRAGKELVKCTAPQDPDHILTGDEIVRLAETGSLCDCADFTQLGGDCPIEEGDEFDFGSAIYLLKTGKKVARAGWNGKDMFLYYVPAASYPMQRNSLETMGGIFPDDMVPYGAYIAMKTAQGNVVPWLASQTDVLAVDWCLA